MTTLPSHYYSNEIPGFFDRIYGEIDDHDDETQGEKTRNDSDQHQAGPPPPLSRQVSFHAHETIVHAALHNARIRPNQVLLQWVNAQNDVVDGVSYGKLWRRSRAIASLLHAKGVQRGDRVMISYPPGLEYLSGLMGCLVVGAIACSVYPPNLMQSAAKAKHSMKQFRDQTSDAGAKFALTTKKFKLLVTFRAMGTKTNVTWLSTDDLVLEEEGEDRALTTANPQQQQLPKAKDIAMIQYSSGSTGTPKGIMLSHGAIVYNITAIRRISVDPSDAKTHGVSWLPQYHDYALFNFFFPCVLSPHFSATCASPIDFIRNPLLWLDMIEKYEATHTAAPNFAYGLLAKRMIASGRAKLKPEIARHWFRTNIAAEPIAPSTLEDMVKIIGFPRHTINPTYGLAESCVYVTACIGPEIRVHEGVVSCGMIQRNQDQGKHLVIVTSNNTTTEDDDDHDLDDQAATRMIAPDGEVGEIYIRGPDLASGYWGKPELDHLFRTKLSDGNHYFGTGDLGKVVDGRLYVVGRIKELIIHNGRNIYPTDLERTVEETYPTIVRPGSTVAFEWSETNVALVCEIRDGVTPAQLHEDMNNNALQLLLRNAHNVDLGAIYLLQKGTIPKTTSGKVKRVETKERTFAGRWKMRTVIRKWNNKPTSSVTAEATTTAAASNPSELEQHLEVPLDLPSDKFPEAARLAVSRIQVNPDKLDQFFCDMYLQETPELLEAWQNDCDKSNEAFQSMCMAAMDAIESNMPSVVQFAHLLARCDADDDLLSTYLSGDPDTILDDLLHAGFVLEWATNLLADDVDLLYKKVQKDKQIEQRFTNNLQPALVPKPGRFLTRGAKTDTLYGALDTFGWLKHRSVELMMDQMLRIIRGEASCADTEAVEGVDFGTMNILEATWVDGVFRRMDNALVGSWVALRSQPLSTDVVEDGCTFTRSFEHEQWSHVYKVWNLAFSATLPESKWVLAKLLIPSIAGASNSTFTKLRMISLHMATNNFMRRHLQDGGSESASVITQQGQLALGALNRRWVEQQMGMDANRDWMDPSKDPPPMIKKWGETFHQIDSGHRRNSDALMPCGSDAPKEENDDERQCCDEVESFFRSLLGDSLEMSRTWEENGLTSLMHAELCNGVAEKYFVTLPPTFFMVFKTPNDLRDYINGQSRVPFPVNLPYLDENQVPNDINTVSDFKFRMVTGLGVIALILCLLASFIPSILLIGIIAMDDNFQLTYQVGNDGSPLVFRLYLLPIGVPIFAFVYSLVVIATKWLVVGRYRATEIATPSVSYLQWWFVDRALHCWEFFVGRFLMGTKFAYLFYRLMGASIHPSVRLNTFIREFDLVTIEEGGSIGGGHPIRCRKFGLWKPDATGPTIRFRPIVIGQGCNIKGMVSPGAVIGNGASVASRSVVPEGAQVPRNVIAVGNPACGGGKTGALSIEGYWSETIFEAGKLIWLFAELYIFYGVIYTSWNLWSSMLPSSFRYHVLVQTVCFIPTAAIILVLISILFKWVFIGRRRTAGGGSHPCQTTTCWSRLIDWCVNFHYRASIFLPHSITGGSRLWNLVLKLHGLDIDFYSYVVDPISFAPSQVDCIRVYHSFISAAPTFETAGADDNKIEVVESSIAAQVSLGAGVKVVRSIVRPMVHLEESLYDTSPMPVTRQPGVWLLEILYICTLPVLAVSCIPAFEVIQLAEMWPNWTLPLVVVGVVLLQFCIWTLCLRLWQCMTNTLWKQHAPHWLCHPIYTIYLNSTWNCSNYCMWYLFWGTPYVTNLLRFFGSRVVGGRGRGRVWYNGSSINDFASLTFADRTVLDTCAISSHYQIFGQLRVSPTKVAGVLHPGNYVQGRSVLQSEQEYGPCRNFTTDIIGSDEKQQQQNSRRTTPENCSAFTLRTTDDSDFDI